MAIYAVYNEITAQLVQTFTNKTVACATMINTYNNEIRTFRHLTENQIKSLSYAEAVDLEFRLQQNKKDK